MTFWAVKLNFLVPQHDSAMDLLGGGKWQLPQTPVAFNKTPFFSWIPIEKLIQTLNSVQKCVLGLE